jgi:hypothetical protein
MVGEDIYYLIECLEESDLPIQWRELPSIIECLEESDLPIQWRELPSIVALQLVWQRHYQVITDEATLV